jgi:glyoxylase-like metal-dependent hydrolase (beta-lactamase superfamily II)
VLITGFPAGGFAANCYVVAPAPAAECVIIDPGEDAQAGIEEILERHRLKPIAVLLTHGHIDHVWSVAPVCGAKDVPAYIHPDDREMLADPGKTFGQAIFGGFRGVAPPGLNKTPGQQSGGLALTEPDDVRPLADGDLITIGGLSFTVRHTPGHTRGSVTFHTAAGPGEADSLFSGDLLFAGSIGRTDLPGGDDAAMRASLTATMTLPDETLVLPGHGPQTTIGKERTTNPFLASTRGL